MVTVTRGGRDLVLFSEERGEYGQNREWELLTICFFINAEQKEECVLKGETQIALTIQSGEV
jgi:hypothetical protein